MAARITLKELKPDLGQQVEAAGLPAPTAEHHFARPRKWRFDFAWPDLMLAAEVEGGTWAKGRHNRPQGYEKDCEKYNAAALLGWTVLRFTSDMVRDGRALAALERALGPAPSQPETLAPPLKYHGGKHYLARKVAALLPPHTHYVEPYFGGGAVLLAKDPEGSSEVANDASGALVNFWKVLQRPYHFAQFVRRAQAVPFSELAWRCSDDRHKDGEPVAWALDFFVRCRQSLAGRMAAFAPLTKKRLRRGMNEQASAWLGAVDGLRLVHERLRRVVLLCRDALDVIRAEDGPDTVFYCDPPYLHATRSSTGEYGEHEMTEAHHVALLNLLGRVEGRFLLSGYPSRLYEAAAKMYGWTTHTFDLPNNAAAGLTKGRKEEAVWCNF